LSPDDQALLPVVVLFPLVHFLLWRLPARRAVG
jgi:hypothetical protein